MVEYLTGVQTNITLNIKSKIEMKMFVFSVY